MAGIQKSTTVRNITCTGSKSTSCIILNINNYFIIQNIVYNLKVFLVLYYSNYIRYFNLYLILKRQPTDADLVIVHWHQSKRGNQCTMRKYHTHIKINTLNKNHFFRSLITILSFIGVEYLCYITNTWNQLALQ